MKTYQELKDNFFEEVGKIDVSKLSLSFSSLGGGLKEYAELLKVMSELPNLSRDEEIKSRRLDMCSAFNGSQTPKIEEGGE